MAPCRRHQRARPHPARPQALDAPHAAARAAARAVVVDAAFAAAEDADATSAAARAAYTAAYTAEFNPDATWEAVNEMLREICGETPRNNGKVTLKSKTKSKVTIKSHDDDYHDHHHHLDLDGGMSHYRDNAGANLRQLSEALGHLSINFPDIMESIEANLSFSAVSTDSKDMAFIVCTEITSKFLPLFLHMKDNRKAAAAAKKLPAVTSQASLKKCLNGLEKIYSELSNEMPESWHRGIYSAASERVSDGLHFIRNAHSLLTQVEHLLNTNQDSHLDWFAGKLGGEFIVNGLNSNRKSIHNHPASSVDISAAINSLLTRLKGGRDNPLYFGGKFLHSARESKSVVIDSFYSAISYYNSFDEKLNLPKRDSLLFSKNDREVGLIFADYALRVFTPMVIELSLGRTSRGAEQYATMFRDYPKLTFPVNDTLADAAAMLARRLGLNATAEIMKAISRVYYDSDNDITTIRHDDLDAIGFHTAHLVHAAYDGSDPYGHHNKELRSKLKDMFYDICGITPDMRAQRRKLK